MVTEDIKETADFVAREVGIDGSSAITGRELEDKSEEELEKIVQEASIFARTIPEQKLK